MGGAAAAAACWVAVVVGETGKEKGIRRNRVCGYWLSGFCVYRVLEKFRECLVCVFKQPFSVFKQHFTHFNILFHPQPPQLSRQQQQHHHHPQQLQTPWIEEEPFSFSVYLSSFLPCLSEFLASCLPLLIERGCFSWGISPFFCLMIFVSLITFVICIGSNGLLLGFEHTTQFLRL